MAYADSQGAIGIAVRDERFPLDLDHEVEEPGGDLIGYAYSRGKD